MVRCTRYIIVCLSVTCGKSVVFSGYSDFLNRLNWPPQYNWNIVTSGVKYHNPYLREYMTLHLYIVYTYNVSFTYDDCYFKLNMQDIIYMYIFCIYDTNTLNIISVLFHADLCSDINRYGHQLHITIYNNYSGTNWTFYLLWYVSSQNTNVHRSSFSVTTFLHVSLQNTNVHRSSFSVTTFLHVSLQNTNVHRSSFSVTTLLHVSLQNTNVHGVVSP